MSGMKKETEEEQAFRKAQEEVVSVLDSTHGAPLPEGTDYYVRLPQLGPFKECCASKVTICGPHVLYQCGILC